MDTWERTNERRRSPLYNGPEALETADSITPGTKADGTPKTVLDLAMYDDVEILMDAITIHYSEDLDPAGVERMIREEYETINGDLGKLIQQNFELFEKRGVTPASIRKMLQPKHFLLRLVWSGMKKVLLAASVGFVAGGLGALLFSRLLQERMPLLWSVRYALLVLVALGAHLVLRRLNNRYYVHWITLTIGILGGALGAVFLFRGL